MSGLLDFISELRLIQVGRMRYALLCIVSCGTMLAGGCPPDPGQTGYANTSDKTNGGTAVAVGTQTCLACHAEFVSFSQHAHALTAGDDLADLISPGCAAQALAAGNECEGCHGPGSEHFGRGVGTTDVSIDRGAIFIDPDGGQTCNACHGCEAPGIPAADGFIAGLVSHNELLASGGHAGFDCTFCHNPHEPLVAGNREQAIRNACTACHSGQNMALHEGFVFERPDGTSETLSCESCHMPPAALVRSGVMVGDGRVADRRTHLFRISTDPDALAGFFSEGGTMVSLDAQGRAALPVEFVCLRCHNEEVEGLFSLTPARAAEIADLVHTDVTAQ